MLTNRCSGSGNPRTVHAERVPGGSRRRCRTGFTVLELLTVVAIMGVLAALLLPAIAATRESARRITCTHQLRQIGLALHSYHEVSRAFPPGWQWESSNQTAYGWVVPLLPYLDQRALYDRTDRGLRVTDPFNAAARQTSVPLLLCPSDLTEPRFMLYWEDERTGTFGELFELPTASYFGVFGTPEPDADDGEPPVPGDGAFVESRPIRLADLARGASNTLIVGERTMFRIPSTWLGIDWRGADAPCRLVGNAQTAPNCSTCDECEFDSRHPGGAGFLWGDGHVSLISESIDPEVYRCLARRAMN